MSIVYYTTNSIGAGVRIFPSAGNTYFIARDVIIGSTDNRAISTDLGQGSGSINLIIEGVVSGEEEGIYLSNSEGTIDATIVIDDEGAVYSATQEAIAVDSLQFVPGGTMSLTNEGTVRGAGAGVSGVRLDEMFITNSGEISTTAADGSAYAVIGLTAGFYLANTGVISAVGGAGAIGASVYLEDQVGSAFIVENSGTIIGGNVGAIMTAFMADQITNDGLIEGDIYLSFQETEGLYDATADIITNSGSIFGDVYFGEAEDQFIGETGEIIGTIYGLGGDDLIKSGSADDMINGGEGADEMWGGAGSDTASYEDSLEGVRVSLNAGAGWFGDAQGDELHEIENLIGSTKKDTLIGSASANIIDGGVNDDIISGLGGNDRLFGGNSEDNILGGSGNDYISGDRHQDRLTGGTGEDVFAFLDLIDSGPLQSERDNITDFTQGEDLIDLTELGDLTFGGSSFTGVAGEIIHYFVAADTRTVVEVDIDGDSNADFAILLSNAAITMTAADFLFV